LHVHINTEHFCIVDSYIYANNNKKKVLLPILGNNGYVTV